MIDKLLNFFAPDDFGGNIYGWLTNQISHCAVSFVLCYLFRYWQFWLLFWLVWELYHYYKSNNLYDFYEDLLFEWGGIFIFIFNKPALLIYILIFLFKIYKKL